MVSYRDFLTTFLYIKLRNTVTTFTMCRGFNFFLCRVVLSKARYCCVVTFLMLVRLTAGYDNGTEFQSSLIQCRMTENGKSVCHSPYLKATIFIFLLLFVVIIGQCAIILNQCRTRHRYRKATVGTDSNDDGLYSDIKQAEFITSLSSKLERNDSIGSSSLNFLSPGGCTSTKSLSNISSASDREDLTDPPKRHDTVIYSEINSKRHTVVAMGGLKESVSSYISRDSQHYDFIKSLSLDGGQKARSSTYCEIPSDKNGILRRYSKIQEDYEGNKPLNVKAEVHSFPTDESDDLDSDVTNTGEENRRNSYERPATYIDVFADEDDYKEYIASLGKSPDEKEEETTNDDVNVTNTLAEYAIHTRGRIPTYLSINDDNAGQEDCPTLSQVKFSHEKVQWRDNKNLDYRILGTNVPLLDQSESDVKVSLYPGMVQLSDTGGSCVDSSKEREKMFGESVPMVSLVK